VPDNFYERAADGEAFATAIHSDLLAHRDDLISERSGVELKSYGRAIAAMREIRRSGSPMERRLRFAPDGELLLLGTGMAHWEAKASRAIERAPYEYYRRYEERGEPVLLFLCPHLREGGWHHVFVGRVCDLVLTDGAITEQMWADERGLPPRPVVDGWITPMADRRGSPKGSGTPHREIDIAASKMLCVSRARLTKHGYLGRDEGHCAIDLDFLLSDTLRRRLGE
jgi:hypothetical protein